MNYIKNDKTIIIDLKNWILKIPGILFYKGNSYLYDQKYYANIFCNKIEKYQNNKNILIQSYDHKLIIEIIEELKKMKNIKKENENINIYGWFDMDDFLISQDKRLKLIKQVNCDGYIK